MKIETTYIVRRVFRSAVYGLHGWDARRDTYEAEQDAREALKQLKLGPRDIRAQLLVHTWDGHKNRSAVLATKSRSGRIRNHPEGTA